MNPYVVLARRTRPQNFGELVGQEVVAKAFDSLLKSGRIPHAFLFTGTRGTGKTSSARILAKSLCCEKGPTSVPCQVCVHCVQITACSHEDILEIDGASHTGVDNVRELRDAARFFPVSARFKVFIIDEVHMLSTGAFNALLKTLEEPPENVIFVLATTEFNKVPATIKSRCVMFSFRKVAESVLFSHLSQILTGENVKFETSALQLLCREAKGSVRDALSLLEQVIAFSQAFEKQNSNFQVEIHQVKEALGLQALELAEQLLQAVLAKDSVSALQIIEDADLRNLDFVDLMENTACLVRDKIKANALEMKVSSDVLSEIFRVFSKCARDLSKTTVPKAWCEVAALDAIDRANWLSINEFLSSSPQQTVAVPVNKLQDTKSVSFPSFSNFVQMCERKPSFSKKLIASLTMAKVLQFDSEVCCLEGSLFSTADEIVLRDALAEFGWSKCVLKIVSQPVFEIAKSKNFEQNNQEVAQSENVSIPASKSKLGFLGSEKKSQSLQGFQNEQESKLLAEKIDSLKQNKDFQALASFASDIKFSPKK